MKPILLKNILLNESLVDILIENGLFKAVTPVGGLDASSSENSGCGALDSEAEIVDCTGKAALPGFINMHTHAGMAMMRGLGEDMAFHEWLDEIWRVESVIDAEYVYYATKVACLEMIKTGTTFFNDQYWFSPEAARAAAEMGLRCNCSYVIIDQGNPVEAERQKKECEEFYQLSLKWPSLCTFSMAFHAIYSVSEEMMLWTADYARKRGLKLHIHLSETLPEVEDCKAIHNGMTPVEYLDSLGILGPDVIAAHTLWLSDNDVRILGERGVTCVHNINSNLKLASGYRFRYNELRDAGANVCIGTDGCASSNNLDVLEALKTAAIVQKAWREDPTAMPLDELLDMATVNGARALGKKVGRIEEGYLADMMIVDMNSYHFLSPGAFDANFVYSAHSDSVESLICDGRFVMRNRVVESEQQILDQARVIMNSSMNEDKPIFEPFRK